MFSLLERHHKIAAVLMLFGAFIWALLVQAPEGLRITFFVFGYLIFLLTICLEISAKVTGARHVPNLVYISLLVPIVLNLGGHALIAMGNYEVGEAMRQVRFPLLLTIWFAIFAYWSEVDEARRKQMFEPPVSPPSINSSGTPSSNPSLTKPNDPSGISGLRMVWARL